jgi:DNA-binding MarR family transcriptional regulator
MSEVQNKKLKVRDIRNGDWYWVPRSVYEDYGPKIGAIGLALYNAYASYARNKGSAFPSQKTIAKKLKISCQTIRKYNKILVENQLIKIESGKGKGKTNIVILLEVKGGKEIAKGGKEVTTGWQPIFQGGRKEISTNENNINENKLKKYINENKKELSINSFSLLREIPSFKEKEKAIKGQNHVV